VAFFEIFEFAEEFVVFGVGDFRLGICVIEEVVVVYEMAKFRDAPLLGGKD